MKAGVNLLNFGPAATPESLARWTALAESLGYHLAMACDHIAVTRDIGARYPAPLYDPFTTLAWLAGKTQKIALGTTVIILPYRDPMLMARMVASLDQFSGGRFIFGIGAGWSELEFQALNIPFHRRGAMTDEYLAAMKVLWAEDVATFDGEFTKVTAAHIGIKPVQKPHPRMWMTANGDGMVRRIARMGYVWYLNPHADFDTLARQVELYKAVRDESGFGPVETLPMSRETCVAETRQKAQDTARPFLEGKYKVYAQWGQDKAMPGEEDFTQSFDELSRGRFIVGSPDDVIADLTKFQDIGVTHASLRLGWPGTPKSIVEGAMRLAAKEVLPAMKG